MNLPVQKRQYVLWLDDISPDQANIVGRKATVLFKLNQAGINVPKTFLILPNAFSQFIADNFLEEKISHQIQNIDPFNPSDIKLASDRIKKLILHSEINKQMALEIFDAYHQISDTSFVSIRGSAKDPFGKISHQQPFLGIRGDANVLEHIKKMWANHFSHKLISSINTNIQLLQNIEFSVMVEHLVNSESSGVAFSQSPDGFQKDSIYIQAVWGIRNEYIESSPYPDLYIISKDEFSILQKEVISQDVGVHQIHGSVQTIRVPHTKQNNQKLSDQNIVKLSKIITQVQKQFFFPQKVEWAQIDQNIYIIDTQDINPNEKIQYPKQKINSSIYNNLKLIGTGNLVVPGIVSGPYMQVNKESDYSKIKPKQIIHTNIDLVKKIKLRKVGGIILNPTSPIHPNISFIKDLGLPCLILEQFYDQVKTNSVITLNTKAGKIMLGSTPAKTVYIPKINQENTYIKTATKLFVNLSNATNDTKDIDGVGILRSENIIDEFSKSESDSKLTNQLYVVINEICDIFKDKPVLYRFSDHKQDNPLGLRGVSKHIYSPSQLKIETRAFLRSKENHPNLHLLIPFIRTNNDIKKIKVILSDLGINRNSHTKFWIMVETPSCALSLNECIDSGIDGIIIGLNDLSSLVMGVDRQDGSLADIYNSRHSSITKLIKKIISTANKSNIPCILSGDEVELHPDLIEDAIKWGVYGFSVSQKSIPITKTYIVNGERSLVKADNLSL